MAKQSDSAAVSVPLPKHPVFKPFSAFQAKSYLKQTAQRIRAALDSIDAAFAADPESSWHQQLDASLQKESNHSE